MPPKSSAKLPRWSAKSGKITLKIEPTKARGVSSSAVVVGIPLKTNPWVLEAIECAKYPLSTQHLDESVIACVVYQLVKSKLLASTKSAISCGASSVEYGCHGDEFQICVAVPAKISSARKVAGLIISQLKFGNLYSKYAAKCRDMGVKPDRAAFDRAASEGNSGLNSGIQVTITGRIKVSKRDLVDKAVEVISKKLKISDAKSKGSSRSVESKEKLDDYYSQLDASSGLEGIGVKGYLDLNLGISTMLSGGKLWVPASAKINGLANSDRIKKYAASLGALGDELTGALVHTAATKGLVHSKHLDTSKTVSESAVASVISKALK
jgi:hypothetical protein